MSWTACLARSTARSASLAVRRGSRPSGKRLADRPDHTGATRPRAVVVAALGTAQTLAWASSYYLPATLADPIAASTGVPRSWVFGAFSAALLLAAFAGPAIGRAIDRRGGRGVLVLSNVVLAAGLALLAVSHGPAALFAAWGILGIGMSLGLYDAGFATLAALYGHEARGPITGITLFAGFASTVSWPLSTFLNDAVGWRETVLVWAALNIVIGIPLNLLLPVPQRLRQAMRPATPSTGWKPYREMLLLAFVFAAVWFVTGAMAAHLPRLLETAGATPVQAIAAAALVGPAQVAARLVEFFLLRRAHPLMAARVAAVLHPVGSVVLALGGAPMATAFVIFTAPATDFSPSRAARCRSRCSARRVMASAPACLVRRPARRRRSRRCCSGCCSTSWERPSLRCRAGFASRRLPRCAACGRRGPTSLKTKRPGFWPGALSFRCCLP